MAGVAAACRRWNAFAVELMYGLHGERRLTEIEFAVAGRIRGPRPLRIGNAAYAQMPMDCSAELMDSFHLARNSGLTAEGTFSCGGSNTHLLGFIAETWQKPDNGIWEVRGELRHSRTPK